MDRMISMSLFLLHTWCSLHTGGLVMVSAQPMLSAVIITPLADRKEGEQVQVKCTATNIVSVNLEWMKDNRTLRRGKVTKTTDQRFTFDSRNVSSSETIQEFNITDLQRDDAGEYICNVYDKQKPDSKIFNSTTVTLSVLYFPSESFPMCSPAGPITVDNGTELNMRCSSESGNPEVMMQVYQIAHSMNTYTWSPSSSNDTVLMSLDLIVDFSVEDVQFVCMISSLMYFPDMNLSCTIGPIKVRDMTQPTTTIAVAVAGGVVAFLLILILIVICRRRLGLCHMQRKSQNSTPNTNLTNVQSTLDEPQHSRHSVYENAELDIHDTQINEHNIYHRPDEVTTDTSLPSGSGASYSGTMPARRAEDSTHTSLLYAKPHKANKETNNVHGSDGKPQLLSLATYKSEQSFTNPVFNSKDAGGTSWPTEDRTLAASVKPVAWVKPISNVPRKPQPYKPKSERTSNTHRDGSQQGIQTPTPSPAPQETPPVHPNDDTPSGTHVNSHDGIYAQVSAPLSQSSSDSQRPDDIIAYAELDLLSEMTEDGGQPSSSSEPVMYATVMKTK